ncbi:hypothetical protein FWF74_03565 [Candidatus Saccharibacteria bacterium]|nr:hypothetical protein [Candidatus Saccharibacteria bacterium]MCL1962852.1 hypothetical protein [Candidatus Saccharibacteria bacterium]
MTKDGKSSEFAPYYSFSEQEGEKSYYTDPEICGKCKHYNQETGECALKLAMLKYTDENPHCRLFDGGHALSKNKTYAHIVEGGLETSTSLDCGGEVQADGSKVQSFESRIEGGFRLESFQNEQ